MHTANIFHRFHFYCLTGRLGRVKIVTLRVGARAKEGKGGRGADQQYEYKQPAFARPSYACTASY